MKSILILRDRPSKPMSYVIDHYTLCWKNAGYRVINHIGLANIPVADIVIVHIDLTVIPKEYVALINGLHRVINGKILDISRQRFSKLLLSKNDNYTGPVIVKTNANYGGILDCQYTPFLSNIIKEKRLSNKQQLHIFRFFLFKSIVKNRFLRILNKWDTIESLNPLEYPIFRNIKSVPYGIWKNNNLIIEPFISSLENGLFYAHYYIFFGDKEISGRISSPDPIVKFNNCVSDEEVPVPDEVKQWRKDLKIDYGRFDYLVVGGKYFLIDVNKTEGGGDMNYMDHKYLDEMNLLASGLEFYLGSK
jgi:hypothetical protein